MSFVDASRKPPERSGYRLWPPRARAACVLLTGLLPWGVRRAVLNSVFGYEIAQSSSIGLSWIEARRLVMGDGARIGNLNVFRGLDLLQLGDHAVTGGLNWVAGEAAPTGELVLGPHSAVTARHYIDCTSRVEIGEFATVAGWRSVLLTRGVDLASGTVYAAPISIGRYCFVGSSCVVLPGAQLPDYSVLGAASVLRAGLTDTYRLYAGSPARPLRAVAPNVGYFARREGVVK